MVWPSFLAKIFVKHAVQDRNTCIENIISNQDYRIVEASSRDARKKLKILMNKEKKKECFKSLAGGQTGDTFGSWFNWLTSIELDGK